jgi:hypothetical protein
VIHRVKKKAGEAPASAPWCTRPKKSRVWSSAISTMTTPRRTSMAAFRAVRGTASGRGGSGKVWNRYVRAELRALMPLQT